MIPLRDVIPTRTAPFVTLALIAAHALVFLYQLSLGGQQRDYLVLEWGLVPVVFSWTALLTSMLFHASALHLGSNLLCLWIFGGTVEDRIGHGRFLVLYLFCGAVAGLAQAMGTPASPVALVGASGAVAGVMGGYFLLYPRSRVVTLVPISFFVPIVEVPASALLAAWFAAQFASGLGAIDTLTASDPREAAVWSYAAGLAAGGTAVLMLKRPERLRVEWWNELRSPR